MEIDVSKCEHYKYDGIKKPLCRSGGCRGVYRSCLCVENTNCYYKQLQQLKAENEELKEQLDAEMLKTTQLATEIVELKKYIDRAGIIGIIKVLKCLDEIEEMLKEITKEDICVDCSYYETQDRCYECDYEYHRQELYFKRTKYNLALEILQKIKEVKGNEQREESY